MQSCSQLRFLHEYEVSEDEYLLEVGPSPVPDIGILLEDDWAFQP